MAQPSSPADVDPLTPTPPIVSSPTLIGRPPRSAMTCSSWRWPLKLRSGAGTLRPLRRRTTEGARRIGLALCELDIVRCGLVALEKDAQPSGAVDHRHGDAIVVFFAFGDRRLGDRERHMQGYVALHEHLPGARRRRRRDENC
jgi:hypothetical protein